jgi:DNA polymerase III alpha subunit
MYVAEAIRLGIEVRGPHVNHSKGRFSLVWEGDRVVLWMGLGWIKGLYYDTVKTILCEREKRPFAGLRDLAMRVPLCSKEIAHLVQCGAANDLGASCAALLAEARTMGQA